ncbi:hypothetical protein DM02DRAFT_618486 [Periconia macrospinosa]|uniref:Uncharacterized protein n=1 Tax=Periconia macrospinosa TaxID=97972 RepID=A0A2V1D966_9PLEO|nr:hypothetical protein DM02DRAFT_618486 [Periconia macrospinosa]
MKRWDLGMHFGFAIVYVCCFLANNPRQIEFEPSGIETLEGSLSSNTEANDLPKLYSNKSQNSAERLEKRHGL